MSETKYLFERDWTRGTSQVKFRVDETHRSFCYFIGKGTMDGARAFLRFADEAIVEFGDEYLTTSLVDLSQLHSAPLRSQFLLGKWLFKNKRYIAKIAVFGGKPYEMAIARAVMKIARMKQVGFFKRGEEARAFLGFPADVG